MWRACRVAWPEDVVYDVLVSRCHPYTVEVSVHWRCSCTIEGGGRCGHVVIRTSVDDVACAGAIVSHVSVQFISFRIGVKKLVTRGNTAA